MPSWLTSPAELGYLGSMLTALLSLLLFTFGCAARSGQVEVQSAEDVPELRAPAAQDFVFGPGDSFDIKVWKAPELDMTVTIAPDGRITFPIVGHIQVAGLTYPELVDILESSLAEYYRDPQVAVNVVALSSQKVYVLGEVSNPAVLQLEGDMSVLEAMVRAGGINPNARTDNVLLIRGDVSVEPELYLIDVAAIYGRGEMAQMVYLQQGDIVYVPTKTITNVERFFKRLQSVLAPFVSGSAVYRNAVSGGAQGTSIILSQ